MSKTVGFFFGAGAELAYGFPTGGQFALDIFRRDSAAQKQKLLKQIANIDRSSAYAAHWLPQNFEGKRISSFGKTDHKCLLESSLENRSGYIRAFFDNLDFEMRKAVSQGTDLTEESLRSAFKALTREDWGTTDYTHLILLNDKLNAPKGLFGTEHLSALLKILQSVRETHKDDPALKQLSQSVVALLQLIIGSCSKQLVSDLNQHIFEKAPNDLQIFDDIGGIFSIDINKAGIDALEIVLEGSSASISETTEPLILFSELARRTLERLLANCLDYQELIDGHFRYLYCPSVEWSKFTKIAVFLSTVREYMVERQESVAHGIKAASGFYHDLSNLLDSGLVVSAIGTSNYTSALEDVLGNRLKDIPLKKLNGSLNDFYDPYLNKVESLTEEDALTAKHILVPFLFTQSGVKPLTSISMSRRYVELHDKFIASSAIVVVGFGFNSDDGHLNALFRSAVDEHNTPLVVFDYSKDAGQARKSIQQKLRIQNANKLHVRCIDDVRMTNGNLWTNELVQTLKAI